MAAVDNSSADQENLIEDASNLICDAYQHDHPGYRELLGIKEDDDVAFRPALYSLFARHTRLLMSTLPGGSHSFFESVDSNKKKLVCFFFLTPNDHRFSIWQQLYYGVLMLPLELGWQTFKRMMKTADFHGGIMKKVLNGRKALVLTRMVVLPELQGKGLGSKYLQEVLENVADTQNLPVVLSTQSMRNVNFYRKRSATANILLFFFL
jgi:GNAT superfamily N-acetyltransferase